MNLSFSILFASSSLVLASSCAPKTTLKSGTLDGSSTESTGDTSAELLYPLGGWVDTCEEAGGGIGAFGSPRAGGSRKHAGCDLYSTVGRPIYAVEDGTVLETYLFYCDTDALVVKGKHTGRVIRYGEIRSGSPEKHGVSPGDTVKKGQVIAEIGKLSCYSQAMLHFELYSGSASGGLTVPDNPPYQRRSDLINPTKDLKQWRADRFHK